MRPSVFPEGNPLERETEQLLDREGNKDLQSISKVMALSRQKKLAEIQSYIQEITDDPDKQFHPETLKVELEFLKLFYKSIQNSQTINSEAFKHDDSTYMHRINNLNINMKLRKGEPVTNKQINQLCSVVQKHPKLKQEVLLKIVGCTSVQRLIDISSQEIEDLTPDLKKRGIKLQIAADWKYFVQIDQQAVNLKAEAVRVWTKTDQTTRTQQAKKELEELTMLCKGQKIVSPYVLKLVTVRKIISMIRNLPDLSQDQLLERRKKKAALPIIFPYILKNLQLAQNERKVENSSVSTSTLRKKGIVEERRQIGKKFFEEVSKNNFLYANFIPENRFQFDLLKRLMLMLGVLNRIYKKRCRVFWDRASKQGI